MVVPPVASRCSLSFPWCDESVTSPSVDPVKIDDHVGGHREEGGDSEERLKCAQGDGVYAFEMEAASYVLLECGVEDKPQRYEQGVDQGS
jgi:hypothetical protein